VLVNKSQNVLFLKSGEEVLKIYHVSTGKDNITPVGTFKIASKIEKPVWFKAGGAPIPSESPENELGSRWMGFDADPHYGIHGTLHPESIGQQVTAGQRLQADARRLCQVFHNIILNAIQAMPGGGTLTITARDRAITFADTGPGFSASALSRWAEMLYSEKEGGMGIGLSVAREIIRAHGGRLSVANQPRGGAVVRIEL